MLKRAFVSIALLSLAHAPGQSVAPESTPGVGPEKPEFFNRVIANQKRGEAALDLYERIERVETRKNPSDPAPPTIKIMRKPRDPVVYRADLQSLARTLTLLVNEEGSQRDVLEKYAKKKKERNELINATHNAFLFTFVATEPRGDRTLSKFKMEPNPGFKPTTRFTSIFPKVRGFVWIEQTSGELARIEGEVTEDISVGLFLGKIYKGSHFMQERYEFLPGLWLASFSQYDFDGRKLFSGFSIHERTFYSNYRYIGPPKEALVAIREELGHAELDKLRADPADQ